MFHRAKAFALLAAIFATPAAADMEISIYSGYQTSPHSRVEGNRADGSPYSNLIGWQGKSFAAPPYYGARAMWWRDNNIGWGVELTHAKHYAPRAEMPAGFSRLEFTDGHNILTANVMKRWPGKWNKLTPYAGLGLGIAVPHVDVVENGNKTYGYQFTGPAMRLTAGAKYDINDRWNVFGEYQFIVSKNSADLTGGGKLNTRLISNALNIGVGMKF